MNFNFLIAFFSLSLDVATEVTIFTKSFDTVLIVPYAVIMCVWGKYIRQLKNFTYYFHENK